LNDADNIEDDHKFQSPVSDNEQAYYDEEEDEAPVPIVE
jgi:hypothetical protein